MNTRVHEGMQVSPLAWPLRITIGLCALVALSMLVQVSVQVSSMAALAGHGLMSLAFWALTIAPGVVGVLAWGVGVRLFFRRSHTLALSFVAALFLASLVAMPFEFRTFDLEFALHVGGQLALAYLFAALIRSARTAHQAEP